MNPNQIIHTYLKLDHHLPNVLNDIVIGYLFNEDNKNRCNAMTKKGKRCKKTKMDLYMIRTHTLSKIPTDKCYVHRLPEHHDLSNFY